MTVQRALARKRHQSEPAGVLVGNHRCVIEMEYDMVVGARRHGCAVRYQNPPGHAEVNDKNGAVVEMDEDVLGTTPYVSDRPAGEAPGETARKRDAEVRSALLDPIESAP